MERCERKGRRMTEEQSRPDEVQNEATPEELDDVVGG